MHDWFEEQNADEAFKATLCPPRGDLGDRQEDPEKKRRTAEAIQQLREKKETLRRYCLLPDHLTARL